MNRKYTGAARDFDEYWELLGFAQRAVELLKWFNENIPSPECTKLLERWEELQKI